MTAKLTDTTFRDSEGMAGRAARLSLSMNLAYIVDSELLLRGDGHVTIEDPNHTTYQVRLPNGTIITVEVEDAGA